MDRNTNDIFNLSFVRKTHIPSMKSKAYTVIKRKMIKQHCPAFMKDKIKNKLKYKKPSLMARNEILNAGGFIETYR